MGKNNLTPDRKHIQLGDTDTTTNPPGFDVDIDEGAFCSQYSGRIMENPGGGGFGAAYIDRQDYEDD